MSNEKTCHTANQGEADQFILDHVNRLYCAQTHILERLGEIESHPGFKDLAKQINIAISDMQSQVKNSDDVYGIFGTAHEFLTCEAMLKSLEGDFDKVLPLNKSSLYRDFYLLSYLQNAQNMITAALSILNLGKKLVKTSFDELLTKYNGMARCGDSLEAMLLSNIKLAIN